MHTHENFFLYRVFQCEKEETLLKIGLAILSNKTYTVYPPKEFLRVSMCPYCSANCKGVDQYKKNKTINPAKPEVCVDSSADGQFAELTIYGIPLSDGQPGNNDKAVFEQLLRAECVASSEEGRDTIARIREIYELMR